MQDTNNLHIGIHSAHLMYYSINTWFRLPSSQLCLSQYTPSAASCSCSSEQYSYAPGLKAQTHACIHSNHCQGVHLALSVLLTSADTCAGLGAALSPDGCDWLAVLAPGCCEGRAAAATAAGAMLPPAASCLKRASDSVSRSVPPLPLAWDACNTASHAYDQNEEQRDTIMDSCI